MAASVVASIALPISNNFSFAPSMDAYGKLSEYGKLGAWSPLSLFAASEVGAWYDPSDLTTMFQDSAGTTPVTEDGQPVGLILDKSKGLVLGVNWFSGFSSVSSPWVSHGGTSYSIDGSQTGDKDLSGTVSAIPAYDVFYKWIITASGVSGGVVAYTATPSPSKTIVNGVNTIIANANSANIIIRAAAGASCVIESVTCQHIEGNHASQATAASRPLKTSTGLSKWIDYDAVDDALNVTFPSSLGSNCTVCRANVGGAPTILTGQTIGTSYASSADHAGLIIVNRALTGQETTDVTAWLTAKGATA